MLKRNLDAEISGKLPRLFILGKSATLVPEFAVDHLPLTRTAVLVPEFSVKDLPLGRTAILVPEFAVENLPYGQNCNLGS